VKEWVNGRPTPFCHLSQILGQIVEDAVMAHLVLEDDPGETGERRRDLLVVGEPLVLIEDLPFDLAVTRNVVIDLQFPFATHDGWAQLAHKEAPSFP